MPTTLSRTELLKQVCEIAAKQVGADPQELTEQTHFEADLGFDSLEKVEFTIDLEETFDLEIPNEAAEAVQTVGAAVELLIQTMRNDPPTAQSTQPLLDQPENDQ